MTNFQKRFIKKARLMEILIHEFWRNHFYCHRHLINTTSYSASYKSNSLSPRNRDIFFKLKQHGIETKNFKSLNFGRDYIIEYGNKRLIIHDENYIK